MGLFWIPHNTESEADSCLAPYLVIHPQSDKQYLFVQFATNGFGKRIRNCEAEASPRVIFLNPNHHALRKTVCYALGDHFGWYRRESIDPDVPYAGASSGWANNDPPLASYPLGLLVNKIIFVSSTCARCTLTSLSNEYLDIIFVNRLLTNYLLRKRVKHA